jgi:hypothetical protein
VFGSAFEWCIRGAGAAVSFMLSRGVFSLLQELIHGTAQLDPAAALMQRLDGQLGGLLGRETRVLVELALDIPPGRFRLAPCLAIPVIMALRHGVPPGGKASSRDARSRYPFFRSCVNPNRMAAAVPNVTTWNCSLGVCDPALSRPPRRINE